MKIKIISNGTLVGTKIINEETGEPIENCFELVITVTGRKKLSECTLKLFKIPFEFTGDAEIQTEGTDQEGPESERSYLNDGIDHKKLIIKKPVMINEGKSKPTPPH